VVAKFLKLHAPQRFYGVPSRRQGTYGADGRILDCGPVLIKVGGGSDSQNHGRAIGDAVSECPNRVVGS
jgi:hypothetical protein